MKILVNDMKLKYIYCILNNKIKRMRCMKFCETIECMIYVRAHYYLKILKILFSMRL